MSLDLKALLWDIDGTLIDTTSLIVTALDHTYRTFLGKTLPPDELRGIIGIPLFEQMQILGDPSLLGIDQADMESEFIRYYEANRHLERIVQPAIDALIIGSLLGKRTGLVTSKNNEELANTLPRLGIEDYVHIVVSADDVTVPKPDPTGVLLALRRLQVEPHDAVFIGDTIHDMRAGRAAGVRRCAVMWGAGPRERLIAEEPEIVCDDPSNLPCLLGLRNPAHTGDPFSGTEVAR